MAWLTVKEQKELHETDKDEFLRKISKHDVVIERYENRGMNKKTRAGCYYKVSIGLSVAAYFVGVDLENNEQIVERVQ